MARIKSTLKSQAYVELSNELADDRRSCAVLALAAICRVPAKEAQDALSKAGRKIGKGTHTFQMMKAAANLGFEMKQMSLYTQQEIIAQYPGAHKNLKSVTTHHPVRFAKVWSQQPDCLLFVTRHVAAFVDGQVVDWTAGRAKRVESMYTVTKIEGKNP